MNYQELLELIYERHSGNVKLGLERMESILAGMGSPNTKLRGIHVGGTNGKGSTCAMLEALCRAGGQTTGLNTSPHLVDYKERIRINGQDISEHEIMRIYEKWAELFQANEASFFEITTAMAFYYFLEQQVNTAIFEVGLGGRLDGTNPFRAQVAVITSISYDHVKSLGNSIQKIAWEKAGIIKQGQKVVTGRLPVLAQKVIRQKAFEMKAELSEPGRDYFVENIRLTGDGTIFDYRDNDVTIKDLCVNLIGEHQAHNAGCAIRAYSLWMQNNNQEADTALIREGLHSVVWNGRMQILQKNPTVLIDGAHNAEGMELLVKNCREIYEGRRIIFVLAILRDKNLEYMIKMISETADKVIISKNKSKRAAEISDQVEFAEKYQANYETSYDVVSACKRALKEAKSEDVVIITGSLYTISEVLAARQEVHS